MSSPSSNQPSELTLLQKFNNYVPLLTRIGFALIVLFGALGTCVNPGDERPAYILGLTTIMWVCTRIVTEALDAFKLLQLAKKPPTKDT